MVSVGCHKDQSIVQLVAVQGFESSKSFIRLGLPAETGVRARQIGRHSMNKLVQNGYCLP